MESICIVYQDEWLVAAHKPSGMLCQATGAPHDKYANAEAVVSEQLGYRAWALHRLDRATSGLLLLAKDTAYLAAFQQLFATRQIEKIYHAWVVGELTEDSGSLLQPLSIPHQPGQLQSASTSYQRLAQRTIAAPNHRPASLPLHYLEITLHTGRKHQIRRHFGGIQCPLLGDEQYGRSGYNRLAERLWGSRHLWLHSRRAAFIHPYTHEPLVLECPLPETWRPLMG